MKTALKMPVGRVWLVLLLSRMAAAGFFGPDDPGGEDCLFGTDSKADGEWAEADSGEYCKCDNGMWIECYYPSTPPPPPAPGCYYKGIVGNITDVKDIDGLECTCNGVNWECIEYVTPDPEADCHANGHWVHHGHDFVCEVATCTCDNGVFVDCKPHPSEDKSCFANGTLVPHGSEYEVPGRVCTCKNGQLKYCEDKPQAPYCYYGDGYKLESGGHVVLSSKVCTCLDGLLGCEPFVPQDCLHDGQVVLHGSSCSDEEQTCKCYNGKLTDCEPLHPEDCLLDNGVLVQHGTIYADDLQSCHCDDGKTTCTDLPQNRPCVYNGVDYAHDTFFNTFTLRCQCLNTQIINCEPLNPQCKANDGFVVPHGHHYDNGTHTCTCSAGYWTDCKSPYQDCVAGDGSTVSHGSPFSNETVTCLCTDGYLTCENKDDSCYIDGMVLGHEDKYFDGTKICKCVSGHLTCYTVHEDRPCYSDGEKIPHLEWFDTDDKRCLCVDSVKVNCMDLCHAGEVEGLFLFDRSSSINEDDLGSSDLDVGKYNWESMRNFTAKVVEQVPFDSVSIAYSSFADHHRTEVSFHNPLSSDKNGLLAHLTNWYPKLRGNTRLGNALEYVEDLFKGGPKTTKVIIVLTDGQADDNMPEVAKDLRDKGFVIYGVAVGSSVDYGQLLDLTGDAQNILMVDDFDALAPHVGFLQQAICV